MINYKNIIFDEFDSDLWHTLKNSKLPILVYGMGEKPIKAIAKELANGKNISEGLKS